MYGDVKEMLLNVIYGPMWLLTTYFFYSLSKIALEV